MNEFHGLKLDPFQSQAIAAIEAGKSVLVSAPTGTGKTLIADYLVEKVLRAGGRVVYTAPVKALSNQKYREALRNFGEEAVGLITGDLVINRDAPLRIMTTEILRNMLLTGEGGDVDDVEAIILDELHYIDDPVRGTVWEELLIYLPERIRFLGLSATLSNLDELAGWLNSIRSESGGEVAVIVSHNRAVPLSFFLANNEVGLVPHAEFETHFRRWHKKGRTSRHQRGRGGAQRGDDGATRHHDMVMMLEASDLPALFFLFSRRATERCALALVKRSRRDFLTGREREQVRQRLAAFAREHAEVLAPYQEQMYARGIAFHHAGLNVLLKSLVEELYEQRLVKILYCTSTFALGINMPARTVLFEELEKFNGFEVAPLTVRQFMQKAGRAGRRGLDDEGQVIIRADFPDWPSMAEQVKRVTEGVSEPVASAFNLSFHSVVNLLSRYEESAIKTILSRSFKAYQDQPQIAALAASIERADTRIGMIARSEGGGETLEKAKKKARKLRRTLAFHQQWLWQHFSAKRTFLQRLGYIDADGAFCAGARIVEQIQIEEVFVAELVLKGVFEGLTASEVFALCAGLIAELPRNVRVSAAVPSGIRRCLPTVQKVLEGPEVGEAIRLAGGEPVCDSAVMALAHLWAEGADFSDVIKTLQSTSDVSGDMVGAFRRAKDLTSQLASVLGVEEARGVEIKAVLRIVARGEVGSFR
jgi:superfamily II RNA helicase